MVTSLGFSRRELFAGAGVTLLLSACSAQSSEESVELNVNRIMDDHPFYIAHRGSGDNWTEHTAQAYQESIQHGLKALEVSVQVTSDGVMVCHHDVSTLRLTGVDKLISKTTYAELEKLRNNARAWLGPAAPLLPIPKLKDVLDLYASDHIIFLEDKTGKNYDDVTSLMKSYPQATEHFVWKQPASSGSYKQASALGFKTWGYFTPDLYADFSKYAKNFDFVGIYFTATDQQVKELISYNKPLICWEVHNRSTRDRMQALGVDIMMCSNIQYVMSATALSTSDAFDSGLRAVGDLPSTVDAGWQAQPRIASETATMTMSSASPASYNMGSMAPIAKEEYSIGFSLRWPDILPSLDRHAGIAFGQESDAAYVIQRPSTVGGYHLVIRETGEVSLYSRSAGQAAGNKLATVSTPKVSAGEWLTFQVSVDAETVSFSRTDVASPVGRINHSEFRGRYFSLTKNYGGDADVEFRAVNVG